MGPSLPSGESAIEEFDWRIRLKSKERYKIVKKITETLKKQRLPFSGPEGINEHTKIASRFEEKVFNNASNLSDYLNKISVEMQSIESAVNISTPLTPLSSDDWRSQYSLDSRKKNVDKLVETLKKHVTYTSGQEGIQELRRIAISFEELIFNTSTNKMDYCRKISLKTSAMEEENRRSRDPRSGQMRFNL